MKLLTNIWAVACFVFGFLALDYSVILILAVVGATLHYIIRLPQIINFVSQDKKMILKLLIATLFMNLIIAGTLFFVGYGVNSIYEKL